MHYSTGLEYIIRGSYSRNYSANVGYFSKIIDDECGFERNNVAVVKMTYINAPSQRSNQYKNHSYIGAYNFEHSFTPIIFLSPLRPKARLIDDEEEVKRFVIETFEAMMKETMPENISINILPFNEFEALHSIFGSWSKGILGFSINGQEKKVFAKENELDELLIVIGHEIGHVLTGTLPNKHDEEAKAFAFSMEWAKTIKIHNIANLGSNIKEEFDFKPARNGLHDVAFAFVDFMIGRGRKAIDLHDDLVKRYVSVFGVYC